MQTRILRLVLAAALSAPALAASAVAAPAPPSGAAPLAAVTRATQGLLANGKSQVGVLVLEQDSARSAYTDALLHSGAAHYALRHVDLVVLHRQAGRFVPENMPGQCDGMDACAADAFRDGLSAAQVSRLIGADSLGTSFVVFDGKGRVVGQAYGGFDRLHDLTSFAADLSHATAQHPVTQYADAAFVDSSSTP